MDLAAARVLLAAVKPLVVAAEETDALLRRKLGTAFRYADYAIGGYEVPLNRVLCDFLDPRGPHGQGGAFLSLFLTTLKPEFSVGDPMAWRARLNFPTGHGRFIDIVLMGPDRAAVGLECKPWATESNKQLEDYATCLLEQFQPESVWLVFLPSVERIAETLTGETRSKLGDRFKTIAFTRSGDGRSVVEWLEKCACLCEADKVARFLRDLVEYLDSEFPPLGKEQPMSDKPSLVAMVGFISTNADYIKSAFDIEEAMPQLRRQTAKEFVEGIKPELERDGWEVDNRFVDFTKRQDAECMTYRRPHWPPGWGICLGKWDTINDFYIGLRCPTKEPALNDKDRGDIRSAMGHALSAIDNERASQNEWPAWTKLPSPFNDWRRADTIALLKGLNKCNDDRTAHETFIGWFRDLATVAEPALEDILRRKA